MDFKFEHLRHMYESEVGFENYEEDFGEPSVQVLIVAQKAVMLDGAIEHQSKNETGVHSTSMRNTSSDEEKKPVATMDDADKDAVERVVLENGENADTSLQGINKTKKYCKFKLEINQYKI